MALFNRVMAVLLTLLIGFSPLCIATRRLAALYEPPAVPLTYHRGVLLSGSIPISVIWYGRFTPTQKSIISDFLLSLTQTPQSPSPSVSQWWSTINNFYLSKTSTTKLGPKNSNILLMNQITDARCSMGKSLSLAQIAALAAKARPKKGGIALVLTAQDVAVEGFCMSRCGMHGTINSRLAFIWVGNSATQCPGQCAWPFHQPIYGPQTPPLIAPNGDVGIDGMIINIGSMIASAVTNPFGNGFYQGPKEAPLEAATACPGVYGKGAFPGYPGHLLLDPTTGASYNAIGTGKRKYLLPALFDPASSSCSTLV